MINSIYALKEFCRFLLNEHGNNFDDISVIIPGKRAEKYLLHYLSEEIKTPFFAPEIKTINEWISELTPQKILSQTELIFILYSVHQKINTVDNQDFNDFSKWAKIMLADFDEIDRYMVSPQEIFRDLRNIKEIENWSFNDEELSAGQKKFMLLWESLPKYYEELNQILNERNEIYQGKAYQNAAREILNIASKSHYYFVGFNALSSAEEQIITILLKNNKASFYSEMDAFYFNNAEHEATHFYRRIIDRLKIKPVIKNRFNENAKTIEIIETSQQSGQTRIATDILNRIQLDQNSLNDTTVILADESLLIPLLNELPEKFGDINVTMGYPIKFTQLKSLLDQFFELQFNFQKFKSSRIYYKSFLKFLEHPYLILPNTEHQAINEYEKHIKEKNLVFIEWDDVCEKIPSLKNFRDLFVPWENIAIEGLTAIKKLSTYLIEKQQDEIEPNYRDQEIIHQFTVAIEKFEKIYARYQYPMDLKTFKRIFNQFWSNETVDFLGNPINGLQLMGILETRLLEFENLIFVGMNEGNLPGINISNSYIPYDLKKHHQLPVDEDRQAIFAHHFYRLLPAAKKIYLIYNSNADEVSNSEKSRFITQLENEIDLTKGHQIKHFTYTAGDAFSNTQKISYTSTTELHKKLDDYFSNKGLSPSALNKLISCPLDFYYRYILEMKEDDQVEENIESSTFGTKIHDVLEDIFRRNFLDKNVPLNEAVLKDEKKNLHDYLLSGYLKDFKESEIKFGQNKLSFDISLSFLENFIDQQIAEIKRTKESIYIKKLEQELIGNIEFEINGSVKKIKLNGKVDRIDEIAGQLRIIDYKSGKCDSSKISITQSWLDKDEFFKLMESDEKGYARQLLMYALIYQKEEKPQHPFSAGIISMINLKDWLQNVHLSISKSEIISPELLDKFEHVLKEKIALLYAPDFIFEHNPKSEYCQHCGK